MKRFFLIPLLTLMCSVMAYAAEVEVATYDQLRSAVAAANNGDVIKITDDMTIRTTTGNTVVNVLKSITIDGQGHSITGYACRGTNTSNGTLIAINHNGTTSVDVVIKDLSLVAEKLRAIETRGNIHSLTIENCHIEALNTKGGYDQPITIGGNQSTQAAITIRNSTIKAPVYYPIVVFNPINLTLENSQIKGWNAVYFKGIDSSAGSRGSEVTANNCNFDCPNIYNTPTNKFGMFVCEDDGISITLNNCGMHAEQLGNQTQTVFLLSNFASKTRRSQPMTFAITGDNSYINGKLVSYSGWAAGWYNNAASDAAIPDPCPLSITISGGTYPFNPAEVGWLKNQTYETEEELYDESNIGLVTIPAGYEVKEIETQQGGLQTTLYRVRKTITTSNSINDNVEGQGDGINENTEFRIGSNETVAAESTIANYVEVSNNATLTVPSGKELEVTNGLDVTDGATLVVEAGSTIVVGEGGVTSENTQSIVIEANENGSASFLLDPEVIINTTPNVTIKMTAKQVGYEKFGSDDYYYWFRFAAPVAGIVSVGKNPDRGTYFYKWDYSKNDWNSISALSELVPFQGYTLSTNHEGLEDVEYTFQGQLAGNQDMMLNFKSRGFNYFGNSYTGYIDVHALVDQLMANDNIDGTIYLWDNNGQRFYPVTLGDISSGAVEVTPMQTFILRQINTADAVSTELNYASAIWGNPRYGKVPAPAPGAPARFAKASNVDRMDVVVTAANGKKDNITLKEADAYNADFEKGFDAIKFMNEHTVNLYATIDNEKYGIVATDNLEGMKLSFQTNNEIAYTLSFENVNSDAYAIRDNVTGAVVAIEDGSSYEFAAQPNSTVEGRFEIVNRYEAPTALENTEVKANAKGIYSITGLYLGEDFNALPSGVYVVNGIKIVK